MMYATMTPACSDVYLWIQVIGVFPFLGVDTRGSARQSILKAISKGPAFLGAVAACIGVLPQSVRSRVIQFLGGQLLSSFVQ